LWSSLPNPLAPLVRFASLAGLGSQAPLAKSLSLPAIGADSRIARSDDSFIVKLGSLLEMH
jgi:hypothetical protein